MATEPTDTPDNAHDRVPRRADPSRWSRVESEIANVVLMIDTMPKHALLADVIALLAQAQAKVADYIDTVVHAPAGGLMIEQMGDLWRAANPHDGNMPPTPYLLAFAREVQRATTAQAVVAVQAAVERDRADRAEGPTHHTSGSEEGDRDA